MDIPFPKVNNIFLTHLHVDHWADLPYLYMFGANYGRLDPLTIYGPSATDPRLGTAEFSKNLGNICGWHKVSFGQFPTWPGQRIDVHELDWKANPGVAYNKNGVRITYWPISHSVDGAISYRLDWNGRSFLWTGDGRPSKLTIEHGQGVDLLVTECAWRRTFSGKSSISRCPPGEWSWMLPTLRHTGRAKCSPRPSRASASSRT